MAADNVIADAGSGGATFRAYSDGTIEHPASVIEYVTGGSAGAWTVQAVDATHGLPVAVVGTVPVSGTFWQPTQPVSAVALPLPSGAATAANQAMEIVGLASILSALGGTLTVSVSALPAGLATSAKQDTGNTSLASIDAKTPALGQALAGGSVPVVLTAAQLATLTPPAAITGFALETGGNLAAIAGKDFATQTTLSALNAKITACNTGAVTISAALPAGTNVIGHVIADSGSTTAVTGNVTVVQATGTNLHAVVDSGTVTTVSTVTSLSQWAGNAISTGTGVRGVGVLRVTVCTDDVIPASQSGTWTVQPGNTPNSTPWLTTQTPATSGGCSGYSVNSSGAANQDSAAIKGSAGQVYGWSIQNTTASARYVKLYNKASGATSGDTPVLRLYLPPTGGNNMPVGDSGFACGTGICIRITTGAADSDTGACSANDVLANVFYK